MVISRTPLRMSLVGGGTDLPDLIDKYVHVIVSPRFEGDFRIGYSRTEIRERVDEIQHDLVREALRRTGLARGLASVDARLRDLLAAGGAELSGAYYCTHGADESCGCRKPEPGLLLRAANELGIDVSASWMVGDAPTDVAAGVRAGCRTLRVLPVDGGLLAAAQTIIADDQQREAA